MEIPERSLTSWMVSVLIEFCMANLSPQRKEERREFSLFKPQITQMDADRMNWIDWIEGWITRKVAAESPFGVKTSELVFISKGTPHRSRWNPTVTSRTFAGPFEKSCESCKSYQDAFPD